MDLKSYHLEISNTLTSVISQSHSQLDLGKYHAFASDLLNWSKILKIQRNEMKVLENVAYELQFSLFLVSSGLYRQAFASLRLVLELALSGILFSYDVFYFRKWHKGLVDISWQKITDENTGIFSKTWLKSFLDVEPDEQDEKDIEEIAELAKKTYRNLSAYVHGGNYTWQTEKLHISFNKQQFDLWKVLAEKNSRIINYSLLVRFSQDLSKENLQDLEECLVHTIDDIKITRVLLNRPT